jgi:hypothetical protein
MLDLVADGSSWEEIVDLALRIEAAGATIINTGVPTLSHPPATLMPEWMILLGIGWHEARVPTIATMVPRGAFSWVTAKLKGSVTIPLCTTNRINTPEVSEDSSDTNQYIYLSYCVPIDRRVNFGTRGSRYGQYGKVRNHMSFASPSLGLQTLFGRPTLRFEGPTKSG